MSSRLMAVIEQAERKRKVRRAMEKITQVYRGIEGALGEDETAKAWAKKLRAAVILLGEAEGSPATGGQEG